MTSASRIVRGQPVRLTQVDRSSPETPATWELRAAPTSALEVATMPAQAARQHASCAEQPV
jgi:hypothetical protein